MDEIKFDADQIIRGMRLAAQLGSGFEMTPDDVTTILEKLQAVRVENERLTIQWKDALKLDAQKNAGLLAEVERLTAELEQARDIIRNMHADEFIEGHNRMVEELRQAWAALTAIVELKPEPDSETLQAIRHIGKMVSIARDAINASINPPADDITRQEQAWYDGGIMSRGMFSRGEEQEE